MVDTTGWAEQFPFRWSFSTIDTAQQCLLKLKYAKLDRLPAAPSPALSWGTALHAAIAVFYDQKLPDPPPVGVLLEAFKDHWDDSGFVGMSRDDKLAWYVHGRQVLTNLHRRLAGDFVLPVATEQWFELEFPTGWGPVQLVGSIDHVEPTVPGRFKIVDWKSSKRAKPRSRVASSLQLAIYAWAARELWGRLPDSVALDFIVPGVRVTVDIDDIDVDRVPTVVEEVTGLVMDGHFPPQPNRLCDWCDFRSLCPAFDGDGPDVAGVAKVELDRLERRIARDVDRAAHLRRILDDAGILLPGS